MYFSNLITNMLNDIFVLHFSISLDALEMLYPYFTLKKSLFYPYFIKIVKNQVSLTIRD